jgi:hypothetical protein
LADHVPLAGPLAAVVHLAYFPDSFTDCLTGVPDGGIPGLKAPLPLPVQLTVVAVARDAGAWLAEALAAMSGASTNAIVMPMPDAREILFMRRLLA